MYLLCAKNYAKCFIFIYPFIYSLNKQAQEASTICQALFQTQETQQ